MYLNKHNHVIMSILIQRSVLVFPDRYDKNEIYNIINALFYYVIIKFYYIETYKFHNEEKMVRRVPLRKKSYTFCVEINKFTIFA